MPVGVGFSERYRVNDGRDRGGGSFAGIGDVSFWSCVLCVTLRSLRLCGWLFLRKNNPQRRRERRGGAEKKPVSFIY